MSTRSKAHHWGLHLKNRNGWWHYYRTVPTRFRQVCEKQFISFALHTKDFSQAKLKAAQISLDLEDEWAEAKRLGHKHGFEQGWRHGMDNKAKLPNPEIGLSLLDLGYAPAFNESYEDGYETAKEEKKRIKELKSKRAVHSQIHERQSR